MKFSTKSGALAPLFSKNIGAPSLEEQLIDDDVRFKGRTASRPIKREPGSELKFRLRNEDLSDDLTPVGGIGRKIGLPLDPADKLLRKLKHAGELSAAQIADRLRDKYAVDYNAKTIVSRHYRIEKMLRENKEKMFDDGLLQWDPSKDHKLEVLKRHADLQVAEMVRKTIASKWDIIARELGGRFPARMCKARYEELHPETADNPPSYRGRPLDTDEDELRELEEYALNSSSKRVHREGKSKEASKRRKTSDDTYIDSNRASIGSLLSTKGKSAAHFEKMLEVQENSPLPRPSLSRKRVSQPETPHNDNPLRNETPRRNDTRRSETPAQVAPAGGMLQTPEFQAILAGIMAKMETTAATAAARAVASFRQQTPPPSKQPSLSPSVSLSPAPVAKMTSQPGESLTSEQAVNNEEEEDDEEEDSGEAADPQEAAGSDKEEAASPIDSD